MEHGDGAAELRLDCWVAEDRKIHFAEFVGVARGVLVLMLGNCWSYESRKDGHQHQNK